MCDSQKEVIKFYIREKPYGFLSNFWRHRQFIGGVYFDTNEHYYQSQKARREDVATWIKDAPTPTLAMVAGRTLSENEVAPNWETEKNDVMLRGLRAKFSDPSLKLMLDWTGDAILIEDSPTDMYWGGALTGSKNMLGQLLMEVRHENRI
jgi:ribA/ribD-fused uncharacterized protein